MKAVEIDSLRVALEERAANVLTPRREQHSALLLAGADGKLGRSGVAAGPR